MEAFDQAKQQVQRIATQWNGISAHEFVAVHVFFFSLISYSYLSLNYHNQAEYELSQGSTRNRFSMENEYVATLFVLIKCR